MAYTADQGPGDDIDYTYNVARGEGAWWPLTEEWTAKQGELEKVVSNFSWKDDDVMVFGFSLSGTHLTWTICRMLLQGNAATPPDAMEESAVFIFCYRENQPGRRVLCTHLLPAELPNGAFDKNTRRKFVAVQRNPKDCAVSQYNLLKNFNLFKEVECWDSFAKLFMEGTGPIGDWYLHARAIEEFKAKNPDAQMLIVTYEDINKKPEEMIHKIGDFLGIDASPDLCKEIADAIHIDTLRKTVKITPMFDEFWADIPNKAKIQYRKGKIGDWKNWFTVAQSDAFDRATCAKMEGSSLKFEYE